MIFPAEPPDASPAQEAVRPTEPSPSSSVVRVAVGIAGVGVLVVAALFTVGGALAAPVGMLAAGLLARRKGNILTRRRSWVGAVVAVSVTIVAASSLVFVVLPSGTFAHIRQTMDSASAASAASRTAPPPAWADRMSGGRARAQSNALAGSPRLSHAIQFWSAAVGISVAVLVLGGAVGTVGWLAGLLLAFAVLGRWLPGSS